MSDIEVKSLLFKLHLSFRGKYYLSSLEQQMCEATARAVDLVDKNIPYSIKYEKGWSCKRCDEPLGKFDMAGFGSTFYCRCCGQAHVLKEPINYKEIRDDSSR